MATLDAVELIVRKRDKGRLSAEQLGDLVRGFTGGQIAEYQMSAWLMAALLNGLDEAETVALTRAMLDSGRILALESVRRPKVDKHSTGGVGDKISLCLGPLVASCGVAVPMVSGRGLGHTGGTLDKLEAIDGYQTRISPRRFEQIVSTVGVSIMGQTEQLAPADKRIYALRDVTGTVESIPLIVASILSKKLAEGIDALVLDVKVGRGAFMKDLRSARTLAQTLVRVGRRAGKRVSALLTDMSSPIGTTIGNALEVREAIEVLQGQGPEDTRELTLELGVEMLVLSGACRTRNHARRALQRALDSGDALERFAAMVRAHGGDDRVVHRPVLLPRAPVREPVLAPRRVTVTAVDSLELGLAAVRLGAGRLRADAAVDPAVGIELGVRPGQKVERGQPLAWIHARSRRQLEALAPRIAGAFRFGERARRRRPLMIERIGG